MTVYRNQFDSLLNHSEVAVTHTVIRDLLVLAPDSLLHHVTFLSTKYFWIELLYIETQNLGVSFGKSALFIPRCFKWLWYFCWSLSVLPSSGEYNFCKPKVRLDLFLGTAESTKIHLSLNYQATSISNSRAAFMWSLSLWMTGATWMQGIEMVKMLFWMYIYANIFTDMLPLS